MQCDLLEFVIVSLLIFAPLFNAHKKHVLGRVHMTPFSNKNRKLFNAFWPFIYTAAAFLGVMGESISHNFAFQEDLSCFMDIEYFY